ncbi:MAG: flippase-like domain-containing protein, partial [Candidatus Omnitrophica bacterium]|nr:flippase-like domain-containing protein [Candidatus Omnitrophota bacterium]
NHTSRPHEVVASVLLDRLSGYVGLVILALLALLFGFRLIPDRTPFLAVGVITLILIAILLALFNKFIYTKISRLLHSPRAGKIRQAVKDLHDELYYFRHNKKIIIKSLIFSIFIQMIGSLSFYLINLSLGLKINIVYFFIFLPLIGAITLLPISIGGLGLRDATVVFFFAKAGVSKDLALAMSLLNFFFILVLAGIGGLIYVSTLHHRRIQYHPPRRIHFAASQKG